MRRNDIPVVRTLARRWKSIMGTGCPVAVLSKANLQGVWNLAIHLLPDESAKRNQRQLVCPRNNSTRYNVLENHPVMKLLWSII